MQKVILSQQAIEDLTRICDYLQQRNPAAAKTIDENLPRKIQLVGIFSVFGAGTERHSVEFALPDCEGLSDFLSAQRHRR